MQLYLANCSSYSCIVKMKNENDAPFYLSSSCDNKINYNLGISNTTSSFLFLVLLTGLFRKYSVGCVYPDGIR